MIRFMSDGFEFTESGDGIAANAEAARANVGINLMYFMDANMCDVFDTFP